MEQLALFDIGEKARSRPPAHGRIDSMLASVIDCATPMEVCAMLKRHGARLVGRGVSRTVFASGHLVYKVEAGCQQNGTEAITARRYSNLCPSVYELLEGAECSVLIMERAKHLSARQRRDIWCQCALGRRYGDIRNTFMDTHAGNLGMLRGKLVLLDAGMGDANS